MLTRLGVWHVGVRCSDPPTPRGERPMTKLEIETVERTCPTLSRWAKCVKSMGLPRPVAVPVRILATAAGGFHGTAICFGVLSSTVRVDMASGDAVHAVEALGMVITIGVTCAVATSTLLVLRAALGAIALVGAAAATCALAYVLFAGDSWPLSEYLCYSWQWRAATLWCIAVGAGLGAALVGRRRGARSLWIPLYELAAGFVTIWVVLEPVHRSVSQAALK